MVINDEDGKQTALLWWAAAQQLRGRKHNVVGQFTGYKCARRLRESTASWPAERGISEQDVRKANEGPMGCYEQRNGKFILLSRLFTTKPQAEKERDRLEPAFTYKKVSFGVGLVAKE